MTTVRPPAGTLPRRSSSLLLTDSLTDESQPSAAVEPVQSASSLVNDQSSESLQEVPGSEGGLGSAGGVAGSREVLPDSIVTVDDVGPAGEDGCHSASQVKSVVKRLMFAKS